MEWLTQNWTWIAVLIGIVALFTYFWITMGHQKDPGDKAETAGHGGHGGCCGGHSRQRPSA